MVSSAMGTPNVITIKRIERLSPKTVRLTLDPGEHAHLWNHVPGGYMTFCLPCGDTVLNRSYSLVQAPDDVLPQVIVKETGGARGSAYINREFKEGFALMAYPPQGRLFPPAWDESPNHFVLFAAGAGITPLYSVLQHVLESSNVHEVSLFYGNSSLNDILLRDELEEWARHPRVNVTHILSDGSLEDDLHNGRITASKAMLLSDSVTTSLPKKFLVSGPAQMKTNVLRGLDLAGIDSKDIRYEDFHHPPHLDHPLLPEVEVSADYNGKAVHFTYHPNEESLMQAISNRGLDAPQSCRGGVCGSCRCVVLEGKVSVDQDFALTRQERAEGLVLCCQARPSTAKVKISFKEGQ